VPLSAPMTAVSSTPRSLEGLRVAYHPQLGHHLCADQEFQPGEYVILEPALLFTEEESGLAEDVHEVHQQVGHQSTADPASPAQPLHVKGSSCACSMAYKPLWMAGTQPWSRCCTANNT
jgi:hypothetical protein